LAVNRTLEVDQFCAFLKSHGLKLTPQRMRIAETTFSTHRHFTSEELYELVRKREPLVGRVTVYRTLEHLVASGMVEELSIAKGVATYEHTAGHTHHDHLICVHCGKVTELSSPRLEAVKEEEAVALGWEPQHHTLKVYGLCPDCKAARLRAQPKPGPKS
jgi:Fur family transcriptional regulator, ferric uptake regulator